MSKKTSADGSYLLVKSATIGPDVISNSHNTTKAISDDEILKKVCYVGPDDTRIPLENAVMIKHHIALLEKMPGMQFRIALWPGDVCGILGFPTSLLKPQNYQLIRVYRNAQHALLAIRSHQAKK